LLRALGRPSEALASYEKALAIDTKNPEALNNMGTALHDLGRIAEALRITSARLQHGLTTLRHCSIAECVLGSQTACGRGQELRTVLVHDSKHVPAYNNRGNAFSRLTHYEEALSSYDQALKIDPAHVDARVNRAATLARLDQYDEAIAEYQRLRVDHPEIPTLLNDLVGCCMSICLWNEVAALVPEVIAAVSGGAPLDPSMLLRLDISEEQRLIAAQNWARFNGIQPTKRDWRRDDFPTDKISDCVSIG